MTDIYLSAATLTCMHKLRPSHSPLPQPPLEQTTMANAVHSGAEMKEEGIGVAVMAALSNFADVTARVVDSIG